jgi:hypothetical protein
VVATVCWGQITRGAAAGAARRQVRPGGKQWYVRDSANRRRAWAHAALAWWCVVHMLDARSQGPTDVQRMPAPPHQHAAPSSHRLQLTSWPLSTRPCLSYSTYCSPAASSRASSLLSGALAALPYLSMMPATSLRCSSSFFCLNCLCSSSAAEGSACGSAGQAEQVSLCGGWLHCAADRMAERSQGR